MDWGWIGAHLGDIGTLTLTHMGLAVLPIVLGFVISIPLGYWASRSRTARGVLLTLGNILYTIPSIALVTLVPVIAGFALLDPKNVIFALTIYAIAIMVRSAADAFAAVSDGARQSAVAVGFAPAQRFFRVELPLAGPVLLAGLRVVSVSTVSLVTIGSLAGIDSLGNYFTDGYIRSFPTEIIVGIVAVVIVAVVFDLVLSALGRILLPWNRSSRARRVPRAIVPVPALVGPVQ